jgi:hypothetical protein
MADPVFLVHVEYWVIIEDRKSFTDRSKKVVGLSAHKWCREMHVEYVVRGVWYKILK